MQCTIMRIPTIVLYNPYAILITHVETPSNFWGGYMESICKEYKLVGHFGNMAYLSVLEFPEFIFRHSRHH